MNNYKNKLGVGITIGTGTSNWETIAKQIDLVEQHKLDFAELSVFDWNIICGTKIVDPEIKKLIKICNGRSIGFTVHGELTVNFFDYENIELHKEILKRNIELSSSINALHLVTHFGTTSKKNFLNKNKFQSLMRMQNEIYQEMGDYAKSHNVILVVENLFNFHKEHYAPIPSIVANELTNIGHPNVMATLDFSHSYINCNQNKIDFEKETKTLAPISKHLHVHDSFGLSKNISSYNDSEDLSYGNGDLHLPIGWGNIPFDKFFENLHFPAGLILNLEIQERFLEYIPETINKAKNLFNKARIIN